LNGLRLQRFQHADFRQSPGTGLADAAQGQASNGDIIDSALMQDGDGNMQTTPGSLKSVTQNWKEQ
jgi:hypothetical protein